METVIIGGGAAGMFAAIACAESHARARVTVLERGASLLAKVRVSGGGRCNVTHGLFDPAALVAHYPRGGRALRGPLSRFGPRETVRWFEARGVELKTESDGRMFPVSDDSATIVDCLVGAARAAGVRLRTGAAVTGLSRLAGGFAVELKGGESLRAARLLLATGSSPQGYRWAQQLGHRVVAPVPSLFTFNVVDARLAGLAGISLLDVRLKLAGTKLEQRGPLLITHWGLSGPAVLKLSAWGARALHERGYRATLNVDWLPALHPEALRERLLALKRSEAPKRVLGSPLALPQRLWRALATAAGVSDTRRWAELSKAEVTALVDQLSRGAFEISGKGVFKEEFVTCGGVANDELDFRTMASRSVPGLFFAGEILDIDGVTGGFNFQSAWATGWLAGRAMAEAARIREGGQPQKV